MTNVLLTVARQPPAKKRECISAAVCYVAVYIDCEDLTATILTKRVYAKKENFLYE